ncbi:MAG: DUF885 family protein [Acidobacteriaceae bacterium]
MPLATNLPCRLRQFAMAFTCMIALGLLIPRAAWPQSFKAKDLGPAPSQQIAAPESLEARTQRLNQIFHDYRQDKLAHSPELASALGDSQYDDQLPDYSAEAYNDSLARGLAFIERLGAIDTAGMSEQEKQKKRLLVNALVEQQESAPCKPWQTPFNQSSGIQVDLPLLAETLTFNSADDYDNYIARLNKVPAAMIQLGTDLMLGEAAGRTEPQSIMRKVLAQVNALATAKPEDTPFASPLRRFPADISPQDRARIRAAMLTAIRTNVQPAFAHFAKYLSAQYIPNARVQLEPAAATDGSCSTYLVHTSLTADVLQLRQEAQTALGDNFNLSAFHTEALDSLALPPDVFRQHVETWIK